MASLNVEYVWVVCVAGFSLLNPVVSAARAVSEDYCSILITMCLVICQFTFCCFLLGFCFRYLIILFLVYKFVFFGLGESSLTAASVFCNCVFTLEDLLSSSCVCELLHIFLLLGGSTFYVPFSLNWFCGCLRCLLLLIFCCLFGILLRVITMLSVFQ